MKFQPPTRRSASASTGTSVLSAFALVAIGLALGGCGDDAGETSSSGDPSTSSAGSGEGGGSGSTTSAGEGGGGADSVGNGGAGGTDGGPTGDVWVDADGTIIGRYRATADYYGETIEGLVTLDQEVVWGVAEDHAALFAIEPAVAYYASSDCSGDIYLAPVYSTDPFRADIVNAAIDFQTDEDVYFAVPDGFTPVAFEPGSHYQLGNGCLTDEPGDDVPTEYYPLADVVTATMPDFAPPLTIETR